MDPSAPAAGHKAKLFTNGRSQAVRLPKPFRMPGREVLIRKDVVTGEVILSPVRIGWREVFAMLDGVEVPEGWLGDRTRRQDRDPFA